MISTPEQIQQYWDKEYESTTTPFDIEEPDEWIATLVHAGKIEGHVLDAGCGPGRTALYLAALGYSVLGVDLSSNAIDRAWSKAIAKCSRARFLQANLCRLSGYDNHFDTVVDIGCFHSLPDEDRSRYAASLHWACRPGAILFLRTFSNRNPGQEIAPGLRAPALSAEEIHTAFTSNGWLVRDLAEREIQLNIPGKPEMPRKHCWFAEMHRT